MRILTRSWEGVQWDCRYVRAISFITEEALISLRILVGRISASPEVRREGGIKVTELQVTEPTGQFLRGHWEEDEVLLTHRVKARFALGENAASSLQEGDQVIVVGHERSVKAAHPPDSAEFRFIEAENIGIDLLKSVVILTEKRGRA